MEELEKATKNQRIVVLEALGELAAWTYEKTVRDRLIALLGKEKSSSLRQALASILIQLHHTWSLHSVGEKIIALAVKDPETLGELAFQVALSAPKYQRPPRIIFSVPSAGPLGSVTSSFGYGPYQSLTHSQTLPCMSCNPQAFGA